MFLIIVKFVGEIIRSVIRGADVKPGIIPQHRINKVKEFTGDERRVYLDALETFSHGETYLNTPDPLRTSLQHDYAHFMVACFKRERRNSRRHGLRFY
jgi:hypothetical protein